jgi:hypothetical protein
MVAITQIGFLIVNKANHEFYKTDVSNSAL